MKKILIALSLLCAAAVNAQDSTVAAADTLAAPPQYEFRGVWMASVDNIDWPARGHYNVDSQQIDFRRQLDLHKANGMNAVVVQVRPAADAFYPSPYEPWSQWLTGQQGRPPVPYYDPLAFGVAEAHKRGMEYHAWLNPYRAVFSTTKSSIAPTHISRLHPEWFLTYGTTKYFDPGNPDAQHWVVDVVRDIVSRYDVDAIHMDDYFYPYRIAGKEFPDTASYRLYGKGLDKEAWRRSNTDSIIVKIGRAIKEVKPWVKFGISPFGVWRNQSQDPEGSATQAGVTNYDDLYADILLWLKSGWIDYVTPQLYWEIGFKRADYPVLVDWWAKHAYGRHVYIGHGIYRFYEKGEAWHRKDQIPRQIEILRRYPTVQGSVYFSSKSFERNPNGWNDTLRLNHYRLPAEIPEMPWLPKKPK
ncbi:MAG: hypothetical protein EOO16_17215 [Chitinophagaceae bacterium]|nr:MAG: hypothetical protein EOO16_17215 [Chitinophagaceae bacterium]